jgi:NADH-quinone oxidoreductase subunit J
VATLAFYLFACTATAAGALVVLARNPVHSVLWLILAFFSSAGLFVLLGAEFVAMLMIIVYVGAVAVLFLFVVMMLDVDFAELKSGMADYLPVGLLIGVVLVVQLGLVVGNWAMAGAAPEMRAAIAPAPEDVHNTAALGQLIYTRYVLMFQLAGLILFVAMIGAIVLTLRHKTGIKRQDIIAQIHRERHEAVELKDIKPGQGI